MVQLLRNTATELENYNLIDTLAITLPVSYVSHAYINLCMIRNAGDKIRVQ